MTVILSKNYIYFIDIFLPSDGFNWLVKEAGCIYTRQKVHYFWCYDFKFNNHFSLWMVLIFKIWFKRILDLSGRIGALRDSRRCGKKHIKNTPLFNSLCKSFVVKSGLHNLFHPTIRDGSTWSKFGARGEHGDIFLFST